MMRRNLRSSRSSASRDESPGDGSITRRALLKKLAVGSAVLAVSGAGTVRPARRRVRAPNIVLIMADDLGYECLGCYGGSSYRTPNLDRLAQGGVRFDHCYSQPLCTPSRLKLMTGQYNFRNYTHFGVLDPRQVTFAHLLKRVGYATCAVGKWQLYGSTGQRPEVRGTGARPGQAGFDEYCLWQVDRRGSRYKDPLIVQNGRYRDDLAGRYGPDVFCDYALDFIERSREKPFLLYYPMALVHGPFVPTPDSSDWVRPGARSNPKYFADMVTYMDKIVGRIVRKLDELALRDRTIIFFVGDNGTSRAITSSLAGRPVQGGKGLTTDAGTHVPLIVNFQRTIPPGSVCGDLVDFSDFLPTIAELAGASVPRDLTIDGRSFVPQLLGRPGQPREWLFCYYAPKWGSFKSAVFVRDKRWKLYATGQLFDLHADILEQHPITHPTGQAAEARRRLGAVLDRMLGQIRKARSQGL